jgi:hypothetical protein
MEGKNEVFYAMSSGDFGRLFLLANGGCAHGGANLNPSRNADCRRDEPHIYRAEIGFFDELGVDLMCFQGGSQTIQVLVAGGGDRFGRETHRFDIWSED